MIGLDSSGKTTILYKFKLSKNIHTIPTIGFNVETLKYKNIEFIVWDLGGQLKIRSFWSHYFDETDAIIFVIDSTDKERLKRDESVFCEINQIFQNDKLKGVPILFFANKQDLRRAISIRDIYKILELNRIKDREWFIQGCCAIGQGLYEGLDWLCSTLKS